MFENAKNVTFKGKVYVKAFDMELPFYELDEQTFDKDSKPCPHSPNCFTCPLPDCEAGLTRAPQYNVLAGEHEESRSRSRTGRQRRVCG